MAKNNTQILASVYSNAKAHHGVAESYRTERSDTNGQSRSSSATASKSRREGTSEGAVQIDPHGNVTGPSTFTGSDQSRVQHQGNSFAQRQSSSTDGGVDTKTITVEGGSGNSRGEVTGNASGTARTGGSVSHGSGRRVQQTGAGRDRAASHAGARSAAATPKINPG